MAFKKYVSLATGYISLATVHSNNKQMTNKQANPRQISNLNYIMYLKLPFYTLVTWQESYFII